MGNLEGDTRFIIYPVVNLVLDGQAIAGIIEQYQEDEEEEEELLDGQISITDQDVSE